MRVGRFIILSAVLVSAHLAERSVAYAQLMSPEAIEAASKSNDPKVFCPLMRTEQLELVGQNPVTIYELSSSKFLACVPAQPASEWTVKRSRWTREDEVEWERFLLVMGESRCNTLEKCIKDPKNNTLWTAWDAKAAFYADCADFPYFLRAYFSYKRGLAFSLVSSFSAKALTPEIATRQENSRIALREEFENDPALMQSKLAEFERLANDSRYTWNGNFPRGRYSIPQVKGEGRKFFTVARYIRDTVSTGTYRMFETDEAGSANMQPDFYSPEISAKSIKPGTVLYRPAGHAAIVFKVTSEGAAHFIDAHPDNSVSRGQFNREYLRGNPNLGGGFKNWRPFLLMQQGRNQNGDAAWVEAQPDSSGVIKHATFRYLTDNEIKTCVLRDPAFPCDYSDEQYRGNTASSDGDYRKGKFTLNGREVEYFDYVRFKLSGGKAINPVESFRTEMTALCEDIKGREATVQVAINASVDRKSHPASYPLNIYGAEGEWEEYSSPGRDIRIRGRVGNIYNLATHFMTVTVKQDPTYSYQPEKSVRNNADLSQKLRDLKAEFLALYTEVSRSCDVQYTNSAGTVVKLPFEVAISRISTMSFDPYLCAERRWGASTSTELRDCREDSDENEWYRLTQFLRNRTQRDTAEVMGFSLDELRRMHEERKVDNAVSESQFNLFRLLKEL